MQTACLPLTPPELGHRKPSSDLLPGAHVLQQHNADSTSRARSTFPQLPPLLRPGPQNTCYHLNDRGEGADWCLHDIFCFSFWKVFSSHPNPTTPDISTVRYSLQRGKTLYFDQKIIEKYAFRVSFGVSHSTSSSIFFGSHVNFAILRGSRLSKEPGPPRTSEGRGNCMHDGGSMMKRSFSMLTLCAVIGSKCSTRSSGFTVGHFTSAFKADWGTNLEFPQCLPPPTPN